jgi:hypothetical protein
VRFAPAFGADAVSERAAHFHRRTGGSLDDRADIVIRVPNVKSIPARLGVAAFAAVEAARRVFGESSCEIPDELIAQLEVDGDGT